MKHGAGGLEDFFICDRPVSVAISDKPARADRTAEDDAP
jgi:hypothetical protein